MVDERQPHTRANERERGPDHAGCSKDPQTAIQELEALGAGGRKELEESSQPSEQEHPEGRRKPLHTLARVENQAVAVQQVRGVAQDNEAIIDSKPDFVMKPCDQHEGYDEDGQAEEMRAQDAPKSITVFSATISTASLMFPGSSRSDRFALGLVLLGTAVAQAHFGNSTVDDAFISFRYAESLANGRGLVFNPGERVEGYSNFLWTILMLVPIWLGIDRFEFGLLAAGKVLGGLLNLATIALLWHTAALGRSQKQRSLIAPLYLAGLAPFLIWGVSGLETPLVTFLVLAMLHLHLQEELAFEQGRNVVPWSYVALVFASLTRPEPVLLLLPLVGLRWLRRFRTQASFSTARRELGWLLLFVVPYGAFLTWRLAYFGDLLPNTYYAKVHDDPRVLRRGWFYLQSAGRDMAWGWLAPVGVLTLSVARRHLTYRAFATSLLLLASLGIVWCEGGDWMAAYRMLMPSLPLLALLVQEAWSACGQLHSRDLGPPAHVPAWVAPETWVQAWQKAVERLDAQPWYTKGLRWGLRSVLLLVLIVSAVKSHAAVNYQAPSGLRGVALGGGVHLDAARWIRRELPASSLLALGEAGLIPYYTKLPVLDLLGLMDRHIARQPGALHTKFDVDYVFHRNPSHIFLLARRSPEGTWLSDQYHARALFEDARFERNYVLLHDFGTAALFARSAP